MEETKTIELNSNSRSILKVGLTVRAVMMLLPGLSVLLFAIHIFSESPALSIICFLIGFVFCYIFFRILNSAFFKELLVITKQDITVIHKNLTNEKKFTFPLGEIKYFGFSEQKYTKHALDNPIIDFTGLATSERELQYIIDEGNIKIETDTRAIKFGKNLPSWDVEEIIEKVELFTGRKFTTIDPEDLLENSFDENESQPDVDMVKETRQGEFKKYTYSCEAGELIIEQRSDTPSSEDLAYLNGNIAPTGKYQIGEKKFVLVSNGVVYAIRT